MFRCLDFLMFYIDDQVTMLTAEDTQGRMFELSRIGKLLALRPEPWELAPA